MTAIQSKADHPRRKHTETFFAAVTLISAVVFLCFRRTLYTAVLGSTPFSLCGSKRVRWISLSTCRAYATIAVVFACTVSDVSLRYIRTEQPTASWKVWRKYIGLKDIYLYIKFLSRPVPCGLLHSRNWYLHTFTTINIINCCNITAFCNFFNFTRHFDHFSAISKVYS